MGTAERIADDVIEAIEVAARRLNKAHRRSSDSRSRFDIRTSLYKSAVAKLNGAIEDVKLAIINSD